MTKNNFQYLLLILILLSACDKFNNKGSCFSNTNPEIIMHDEESREYLLYLPDSYDGTTSVPLMLNFHGFGGSATEYMLQADMHSIAESEIFILVYPQGSCLDGFTHWNSCPPGGDNKSDADDFGFVEALITEVSSSYNVDMDRIYATGYSNGGMMAYGLANYKSELIAAVSSVSGTMLDCIGTTIHPMPVLHLHGTSDDVIPYNGSNDYSSAQNVLDHWIGFNNTTTMPTVSSDNNGGLTIEHYVYDQGDSSVSVEHFKYIDGGHDWFNATYQGEQTADLIWNFVSRYDINGLR